MPDYNWVCHACSNVNEANLSHCSKCGLSAYASAEEIELHSTPGAYKKKKAIEKAQKAIGPILFIPFFSVKYGMTGNIEMLLLLIASIGLTFKTNSRLLLHIWEDRWASTTLFLWSSSMALLIFMRITFVSNKSIYVSYFAFATLIVYLLMIVYFFKSKRGIKFFSDYYEKANKAIQPNAKAPVD